MSINIWTDSMQHAALLGKPVLFTNWLIQRDIIPDGWYCYDLRGTHKSPSTRTTLVDHAADYHAGTVLSPIPLKHEGTASRRVNGTFYLLGEEMTLEQFCEEHDLAYPQDNREFVLRPASLDEVGLFYSEEKLDEALGTVGHLRMDFGHGEKEFWHTWWPHNEDRFNTPEFKEVLQRFVDDLRQTGLLKNLGAMDAYCWQHGGSITEDRRSYGYIAETENYRFCLRCTPFPGEYVEIISVTASSGYDANTGEPVDEEDDKELPDTVTLLVSPEQAKVLAELEAEGTIHLALVYRGDRENADKFLTSQDEIILELYPPEPDPEEKPQENPAESEPAADSSETAETEAPAKTEEVA